MTELECAPRGLYTLETVSPFFRGEDTKVDICLQPQSISSNRCKAEKKNVLDGATKTWCNSPTQKMANPRIPRKENPAKSLPGCGTWGIEAYPYFRDPLTGLFRTKTFLLRLASSSSAPLCRSVARIHTCPAPRLPSTRCCPATENGVASRSSLIDPAQAAACVRSGCRLCSFELPKVVFFWNLCSFGRSLKPEFFDSLRWSLKKKMHGFLARMFQACSWG